MAYKWIFKAITKEKFEKWLAQWKHGEKKRISISKVADVKDSCVFKNYVVI